jgi:hypothetical protein
MEVYFVLKNLKTFGKENPFYSPQRKLAVWGEIGFPVEFPVGPEISG